MNTNKDFYNAMILQQKAVKKMMKCSDPNALSGSNKDVINLYSLCGRFLQLNDLLLTIVFKQQREIDKLKSS